MRSRISGFSLVEIAVVIVLIGLIVGGVVVGSQLLQQAEVRKVISEWEEYQAAIYNFETQYGALPGDMRDASSLWPTAIDGNGDGRWGNGTAMTPESFQVWQHLILAGNIISIASDTGLPASRRGRNYWYPYAHGAIYGVAARTRNTLTFAPNCCWGHGISPLDAWNIDRKIDDGFPATGDVMSISTTPTNCVKDAEGMGSDVSFSHSGNDVNYDRTSANANDQACIMLFYL